MNFQIVNIGHYLSRTGANYLHSLLDNHPQILTIPGVINFRNLLIKKPSSEEEAFNIFEKENPKFFDTSKQRPTDFPDNGLYNLGENKDDKIIINKEIFKTNFFSIIKNYANLSFENIMISLNLAYGISQQKKIEDCKVLLLHPHAKDDCITFNKLFRESKFL